VEGDPPAFVRSGVFYGPGTSLPPGEEQLELVRERKFPLVGDGVGVWSSSHIADAAEVAAASASPTNATPGAGADCR
jgi:hypothetical protein